MGWIGKILCKLGIHKWYKVVDSTYSWKGDQISFKRCETRCKVCNKLKQRDYDDIIEDHKILIKATEELIEEYEELDRK